ncbi:GPI anchored surface protein [Scheffersomyces stipitis CBS 6054]|uniref:1,3-beta-glucanosyltransferase n=1 Tax=Scheffersomyces stipitis (strain ATCC 58785 / CBS 6054 / NBRC 10063 / NRRL Y-11545) TaxID=322104 RepID=A3LQN9_PICST|nr:GPI anchored surface protein [Scheffersomyces stipitis CBS 6054]ABN65236.1 GPI anchored surface protein [Scheffersomyces stipitis CBS 6054]KAG2736181.1 hypothetical protein G9P44_000271 [Scheffersomyces stipitis]
MRLFKTSLVFLSVLAATAKAVPSIVADGNAFFVDGTSNRFYIRGVDYQPGGSSNLFDPLADAETCKRDIKYFTDLGINTVRVYSVDNTADHDECMSALEDAGIYVIVDVNNPHASILRSPQNMAACSYNSLYINEVLATVQEFAQYNNTLGFFAGNEVINDGPSLVSAPYVKATVRDIKTFLKNRNFRQVLVGYSAAAVDEYNLPSAEYFNCGDDELARVDMFGFNDYTWCGDATMQTSSYSLKVQEFSNYSIPLFFSEFGCNKPSPRVFSEIEALYSTDMSAVFSGGLVYEYSQEASNYGLVEIDGNSITTDTDFDNLKKQYADTKNPSGDGGYSKNLKYSDCPKKDATWNATTDIPDTPAGALKYVNANEKPVGGGFNASTQFCIGEVDDSGNSTISETTTSGGSSTSATTSEATSSSSKKSGAGFTVPKVSGLSFLGVAGAVAGMVLL